MSQPTLFIAIVAGCYLLGAIPFGYLVARSRGVDILATGSGNIGATNVGRVLGRRFGIAVFLLDFAKGAGPVAVARWLSEATDDLVPVVAGLAAFLGHLFPIYLHFRGGKGVATATGAVAVLLPGPTSGAFIVWLAVVCITRYVSLASLTAAATLCALRVGLAPEPLAPGRRILTAFCFLAAALVFLRHATNVGRLLSGTENRLRDTPAMLLLVKTLHILAIALWFGTAVFFTFVVGLSLFHGFEAVAAKSAEERPAWFPLPDQFARDLAGRKEQGVRAAGYAISPMFSVYFPLQVACAALALATALTWTRPGMTGVHAIRSLMLVLALVSVLGGWWLERVVHDLRLSRYGSSDAALRDPTPENVRSAEETRAEFGRWHFYSLMLNFLTLLLVAVGTVLAAQLPEHQETGVGSQGSGAKDREVLVQQFQIEGGQKV